MPQYTTLGLTKLLPSEPDSANSYAFRYADVDLVDRLLLQLMNHRHGVEADPAPEAPADAPDVVEDGVGTLNAGSVYYYRTTVVDPVSGLESGPSPSTMLTTSGGIDPPDVPDAGDVTVTTTGGTLTAGSYQYAVTAYKGSSNMDTLPAGYLTVVLDWQDGDEQQIEFPLPSAPAGADGLNVYRRSPHSSQMVRVFTFEGSPDPEDVFIDDVLGTSPSAATLGSTDRSASRVAATIDRPDGATVWRIYRSTDDEDWTATALAESSSATFTDTGTNTTWGAPPEFSAVYTNPAKVAASEIRETPHVVSFGAAGAAATGVLGEWVNTFAVAHIAGVSLTLDTADPPTSQDLLADVEVWSGSTWDTVGTVTIADDAITGDAADILSPVALDPFDRVRVNVTQVGSNGSDLTAHLKLWVAADPTVTVTAWAEPGA